ncbi:amidophosphoribosyltransferase [Candidatus Falkowbacteria bacterium CG10_big_fil_rev_8_21_14_0_10_39_11]|uniref:Amidophosphoribosyltransferase n=1 Tax=Candidatus Falkowbacteria bacterium CG10_big_fil_rev_8_21_14_0_10_39_11 TaxID=1974565 RepID=A0A2H0V4K8_9BACT|nr:MAG: amidophosphoribosyltransferase [Candidatus Falkowbacteria bacterium CG10_big_fil_rev_8_21_14_0_10_39_11]
MCGIVGLYGHESARLFCYQALWSIRHRGKGSIGVAALHVASNTITIAKQLDFTDKVFQSENFLEIEGKAFIGHIRWPTQGKKSKRNAQPHYTQGSRGRIAVASNGDVRNLDKLRKFLDEHEIRVYSSNDAEVISGLIYYFIDQKQKTIAEAIAEMLKMVNGAISAVFMADWEDALYVFRDSHGFRPLLVGVVDNRYMIASETCQFDKVGARFMREVDPGEIIKISDEGLQVAARVKSTGRHFCSFEYSYFQRPDSIIQTPNGGATREVSNYTIRKELGVQTAREFPVINCDLVIPSPRSGIPAAIGFAQELNIPYEEAIISEGDIGRTFIESNVKNRTALARKKYHIIEDIVRGKVVCVVDDSAVKLLTVSTLMTLLFEAGAKAIHFRSAAPMYKNPCYYGVETKIIHMLAARDKTLEEMRRIVGSPDSLQFISATGFRQVCEKFGTGFCFACFDGNYPE